MSYDVFGMCNALYDIQAEIPEALLTELNLPKGSMTLIEEAQQRELVTKVYTHIVNSESGGSGANTMIGIAQLGGSASFTSRIGTDEHGTLYTEGLASKGVKSCMGQGEGLTGICMILLTPDAERTMCTFLGLGREVKPADIDLATLSVSKYLYVTGYLWDTDSQKAAVLHAMQSARAAGVKVALSLSDSFCVHRHKADFLHLIQEHVSLLFGNEEEALVLTDTTNPHESIRAMAPYCDMAAVTMGSQGSLLREGETLYEIPAFPIHAVDTTGAGDMYAAGLLYGLTQGLSLETTGRLAAYVSAQVVGKLGPRLEVLDSEAIARICAAG